MSATSRPMKFPYTYAAKLAQFPVKFHINNHWNYRYYLIAAVAALPIFYKINKLANSPENIRIWEEKKRAEAAGHH